MSEWITDREPTAADGIPYVWVTTEHGVVLRQTWDMVFGRPWQPIVPPEPYVNAERYEVAIGSDMIYVCDNTNGQQVAGFITNYEAAERIAAIYEEMMP